MTSNPLVSILINNYNYGRFVGEAIESALAQTYPHREVVVVDDGSTDASREAIEAFGPNIQAVFQPNGGHASAINAGFGRSRGEVVLLLDADDTLLPTAVEAAVEALAAEPGAAKVHWPLWRVDAAGRQSGKSEPAQRLAEGDLQDAIAAHGPAYFCGTAFNAPTSGNAWRRSFLERVFPLPEAPFRTGGVDYFLSVLAPVYGRIKSLSPPQACYRVHGSNDTLRSVETYRQQFFAWFEQAWQALDRHLRASGIPFDPGRWERNTWYHRIDRTIAELTALVPPGTAFVLADGNDLGLRGSVAGRPCRPFMEHEGRYWGAPANDAAAIAEIERQRRNGGSYFFVAWTAFWYLDHYREFYRHLKATYPCMLENDRVMGFALNKNL